MKRVLSKRLVCAGWQKYSVGKGRPVLGRLSALVTFANCTSLLLDPYIP